MLRPFPDLIRSGLSRPRLMGCGVAGLLKGPSYFNPDRHPERAKERLAYVLGRMQEDGVVSGEEKDRALVSPPKLVASNRNGAIPVFISSIFSAVRPNRTASRA